MNLLASILKASEQLNVLTDDFKVISSQSQHFQMDMHMSYLEDDEEHQASQMQRLMR